METGTLETSISAAKRTAKYPVMNHGPPWTLVADQSDLVSFRVSAVSVTLRTAQRRGRCYVL